MNRMKYEIGDYLILDETYLNGGVSPSSVFLDSTLPVWIIQITAIEHDSYAYMIMGTDDVIHMDPYSITELFYRKLTATEMNLIKILYEQ